MILKPTFFLLILLSIQTASGELVKKPRFDRIILVYKKFNNENNRKKIDRLTRENGLELEEGLTYLPVEILRTLKRKGLYEFQLLMICKRFEKNRNVKSCEVDKEVLLDQTRNSLNCLVGTDSLGPLERGLNNLTNIVDELKREKCDLLSKGQIKNLPKKLKNLKSRSPLWAQEYIGSDLAKETLKNPDIKDDTTIVPITIFDRGFQHKSMNLEGLTNLKKPKLSDERNLKTKFHGTLVANLINGNGKFATTEKARFTSIHSISRTSDTYKSVEKILKDKKNMPKLLSMSMEWAADSSQYRELVENGVVIVVSAGNKHPQPVSPTKVDFNKNIIVGSLTTRGFKSKFSQEDPKITISAPSDFYILTKGPEKLGLTKFGGTSAATPVVSGSISNVLSILPKITVVEVKELLKNTAIKTAVSLERPQQSGSGMINAYKLVEVAKKIKKACKNKKLESRCQKKEIKKKKYYKFPKINMEDTIDETFPGCAFGSEKENPMDSGEICEKKKQVLKKMRMAALLNPEDWKLWDSISCVHQRMGLRINAGFYQQLALVNMPEKDRFNFMEKALSKSNFTLKSLVLNTAAATGKSKYKKLLVKAKKDSNKKIQKLAAKLLKNF